MLSCGSANTVLSSISIFMLFICKWPLHGIRLCKQTSHKMFSGSVIQTVLRISCILTCLCSLPLVAINLLKTNIHWPLKTALFKIKYITQATFKVNPPSRVIFDCLLIIYIIYYIWIPRLHNPALDISSTLNCRIWKK